MKLKVCQFAKLILLLTAAFCAELNSLKILNCTTEEEVSMRGGHFDGNCKGYEGVVEAPVTTTVLAVNENQRKKSLTAFQRGKLIDVDKHFWYTFPLKSTTRATTNTIIKNTSSNNILSVDEESFDLFASTNKEKTSAANKKLYSIKKYVYVERKTSKTIIAEPRSSSTFPVRLKRQGNRLQQQETRFTSDELNEPTISQFQAKINPDKQQKPHQYQHQHQQQETLLHRIAVLMPSSVLNVIPVQQGFRDFVNFFHVDLHNITFDFIPNDDLSGFINLLSNHKYKTVVKTLNVDTTLDNDLNEAVRSETAPAPALGSLAAAARGFCYLRESLSYEFNKSVLLWPCPRMKEPGNFLPSFEAISFAVQSIATKLNWSQVDIYVGDENWGIPLAIAANLQRPYKLVIDGNLRDWKAKDTLGQVIIVTADINDKSTLSLLQHLKDLQHTKVLLIDYVANSFNAENSFYKNLARLPASSSLMSNLLLFTVLSDKYRNFSKISSTDNGINMVQNFRKIRRLKAVFTENKTENQTSEYQTIDWPMYFNHSISTTLSTKTLSSLLTARLNQLNATKSLQMKLDECAELNNSINHICQQSERIANNCANLFVKINQPTESNTNYLTYNKIRLSMQNILNNYCEAMNPMAKRDSDHLTEMSNEVHNLRNFIEFFHLYDFLISSTILKTITKNTTKSSNKKSIPLVKYDFIVLDITRDLSNTHNTSATNNNHNKKNYSSRYPTENVFKWRPLLILEQHEINLNTYITHSIQPGYDDWLYVSTTQLWHCGAICWTIIAICFGILLIIVAASIAAGIAMRNYLLRNRLTKGPNKIVLSANDFVFPVDSRRVDAGIEAMLCCWLQQLQEFGGPEVEKPDLLKGSMSSLKNLGLVVPGITTNGTNANAKNAVNGKTNSRVHSLARHNPALLDMRARYNGDLVQLKEISMNGSVELKSKAMDLLVMAHGLRHENINPLIGWLSDPNRTAMVFDYCSRGSLQDVLIMDEIKLDWSFRLSLLTDLVRGMRYLHSSPLRVHGTLTSRNCVVDARWVLKITDYGVSSFYDAQALPPIEKRAKELLWTAPEVLRAMKPLQHHYQARTLGTQMGDVYSFGIIMQEVVVRGEPYCMLSLSAEEIIAKIKKPPPLIRPSVSKGAAPPEAINIMRQCWAEQPEMRPDFNSVYERFKILNHGRKVNFVDTMFQMLEKYSNNLEELIRERTEQLDLERKKTEQLLNRMLPNSVAEKLKMGLAVDPEEFSDVTIYFSDIVGFTTIAAHCSPVQVVDLLNDLYTIFDATINAYNVYKVETIGDAYMVVSGLPVKIPDHAEQIATMALDLLHQSGRFNVKHLPGVPLQLRIGLHTGPCCAGVVGLTMPRYCLFGDTVNTASRMESTGSSWRIHMSQETRDRLEARGGYTIESRGMIDIKGKGMMHTYWLLGKKGFDKTLPTPPPIGESHGLDESLIRNSIILNKANKSRTSTNPSSSRSSSLAGESVEVKVEITPPTNADIGLSNLANSYSIDSNSTATISPSNTLCPEFPSKTPSSSPHSRKLNELSPENLLNPNAFNRLPSSAGGSSSRLYKKLEEIIDISSPYNHYKCLSPSESNLSQFYDGKYLFSNTGGGSCSSGTSVHSSTAKFDSKPGSTRLLRRQFSLDRDDTVKHEHHPTVSLATTHAMSLCSKPTMLEIPLLHDTSRSPKCNLARTLKQNSTSIAQDLEKIEEIPLSPASSQHHSSLDSNINRSPPSTIETRHSQTTSQLQALTSAPTSPATTRSLKEHAGSSTTDASTASANSNLHASLDQPDVKTHQMFINSEELFSS